jgi:hypothetical protein
MMLTILISLVWLINGLYCKVLNGVPRHTEIAGAILGNQFARPITVAIGLSESFLAIWILMGKWSRPTALMQIVLILGMNIIEFLVVPGLLLWGRLNLIFAILFSLLIYVHAFRLKPVKNS